MTAPNTRKQWLDRYQELQEEAEAFRDSQSVAAGLIDAYDELSAEKKADVHDILAGWLVSDDNKRRYDAGFLTSERQIVEMIPAVQRAINHVDESSGPEAKYEAIKLRRILGELS